MNQNGQTNTNTNNSQIPLNYQGIQNGINNNPNLKNIDNNIQSPSDQINHELIKDNNNNEELNKNLYGNAMSIEYENAIREEIELNTPLISEQLSINILLEEYKNNAEYANSIKEIVNKYKYIRK